MMDFKKLNEELKKFVEKEINEISNKVVNDVEEKRTGNLNQARDNYTSGKGSLDSLTRAKSKLNNFKDLKTKRQTRHENNVKHIAIGISSVRDIKDGYGTFEGASYALLTDDQLIKLANLEQSIVENEDSIDSLEEAKNLFSQHTEDREYALYVNDDALLNKNEIRSIPSYNSPRYFVIFVDTTPEEAADELNGGGAKNRKKREKWSKMGQNIAKYAKKGEIDDFEWKGTDDNGNRKFSYSLTFKNPGFPDEDTMEEYLGNWKQNINNAWYSLPTPEPRVDGTAMRLYSNCVEHNGRITWNYNKTITISGIYGRECEW